MGSYLKIGKKLLTTEVLNTGKWEQGPRGKNTPRPWHVGQGRGLRAKGKGHDTARGDEGRLECDLDADRSFCFLTTTWAKIMTLWKEAAKGVRRQILSFPAKLTVIKSVIKTLLQVQGHVPPWLQSSRAGADTTVPTCRTSSTTLFLTCQGLELGRAAQKPALQISGHGHLEKIP